MLKRLRWVFGVGLLGALLSPAAFAEDAMTGLPNGVIYEWSADDDDSNDNNQVVVGGAKAIESDIDAAAAYTIDRGITLTAENGDTLTVTGFTDGGDPEVVNKATLDVQGDLTVESGGTVTLSNKNSEIANTGSIAVSGVLDNSGEITNQGSLTFESGGEYGGSGSIVNEKIASISFKSGSIFDSADASIDNSATFEDSIIYSGKVVIAGDVGDGGADSAVDSVFSALARGGNNEIGNVLVTGDLAAGADINQGDVTKGIVTFQNDGAADYDGAIKLGGAQIRIDSGGVSTFGAAVSAAIINVDTDTEFNDAVSGTIISTGADITFTDTSSFGGGGLYIDKDSTLTNKSTDGVVIEKDRQFVYTGTVDNQGTLLFEAGAVFLGDTSTAGSGVFSNVGGTVEMSGAFAGAELAQGNNLNRLLAAVIDGGGDEKDIGTIKIDGQFNAPVNASDAGEGDFILTSVEEATYGGGIDVGGADLTFSGAGEKTVQGAVAAKTTTVESVTTFQSVVETDLFVDEDATLDTNSTFDSGSITIADTKTLTNKSARTTIADGESLTLNGSGTFDNNATLTFADGAEFVSTATGVIKNDGGGLKFQSDISDGTDNAVQDIFNALGAADIGNVYITGVLEEDLSSIAKDGWVQLDSAQGTSSSDKMSYDIDAGGANLVLDQGGHLGGTVAAATIVTGGATTFYGTVDGNLELGAGDATLAAGSVFTSGKDIDIGSRRTLTSETDVTMDDGNTFSNSGTFDNQNVLTFRDGSTYSGSGVINNKNTGASAELDAGMTGLNAAVNAMAGGNTTKDIGTVRIVDAPTEAIAAATTLAGDVTLESEGEVSYNNAIDLGGANITVTNTGAAGEKTFSAAVSAKSVTTETSTTFNAALNADLNVNKTTTLASKSTFSGHDITIADGETLDNDSQNTTISAGNTLSNAGIFDNAGGTLTIASGAIYASVGSGRVANAGGTANVNTAMTGLAAFVDDLDPNMGKVNVSGQITSALEKSGATGGDVTVKDKQNAAKKIDVGDANLTLDQGGVFTETVEAGDINVKAASTFQKAVAANDELLVNGESTFQETVAAANGVTTTSKTAFMKDVDADALVKADTTFNGAVEDVTVAAGGHARFTGTGDFLSLSNSGETSLAISNPDFTNQFNDVDNLTDAAIVNVIADVNGYRITEALQNDSGRGVFNFGGSGGNVLSIEDQIDVAGGEYHASQGTTQLNVTDATVNPAIIADSFTVDSGATFVYDYTRDGGSGAAIIQSQSGANNVKQNATLKVAAGDTLIFAKDAVGASLSNLTLEDGSKVVLSVAGNSASAIRAAAIEGEGAIQNKSVILDLNGSTLDYFNLTNGLADLLQATDVDWNIFSSDRFIINALDGSLSRQNTGYTLARIMNNRNMVRAGGYFDGVLAWNPLFGARRDPETEALSGGLQGMLDEVYALIEQGRYGAARQMYGAYTGEHLVYSDRGVLKTNDMLWSAVDGRRNANLDLNHGLNTFSARRSAASPTAYGDLVPPNCYPTRSRSRTVRDRNGGYSLAGGNSSVWAEYIGAWTKQNDRGRIDGYKVHANGIALGYEYRLGAFNFGGALSYARAHTKMSDYSQDTTTDAFNMALYADYNHSSGFFARAGLGFSYGWNDYTARGANFHRSGDYKNLVWNLRGEIGYVIRTGAVNIIPTLGLRFSHYHQQGWTDKDKTFRGLHGDAQRRNDYAMDIPLEVRVNKVYSFGGVMIAPEAKLGVAYATKKDRPKLDYGLKGAPGHYTAYGVETGRTTGNFGLGVKAKFNPMVDAGLEYNFEFGKKYRQHSLNLSVGVSF